MTIFVQNFIECLWVEYENQRNKNNQKNHNFRKSNKYYLGFTLFECEV